MSTVEMGSCYLIKRQYGGGWRWVGQIKRKDASGKWRTLRKALTNADGKPITTDADTTDENDQKVQTTRNIRAARKALEAWRAEVEATKPNALDAEGIRRANALLDSTTNDRLRIGARLALACGLRAGECCGIRWRDLDLDGHTLTVREAIGRAEGGTYNKPPKTPDSHRTIPLAVPICAELAAWRESQQTDLDRAAEGQGREVPALADCYILGYADGSFMTPHALGNAWSRLVERGDADGPLMGTRGRRCTFHDLRHTFATHAIANGGDVRSVAALMGHKDASVTLRIYADALPDAKARAMEAVSATLADGSSWAEGAETATKGDC